MILDRRLLILSAGAALTLLAGCATTPPRTILRKRDLSAVTVDPERARALISAYRTSHGLTALRTDPQLTAMARTQADAMARAGKLSHDVAGSFERRLGQAGIDTDHAAENLGAGYFGLQEAIEGWQASPGHNHNLLLAGMTRFGIALAKAPGTDYQTYWAMEVAADVTPRPLPPVSGGPALGETSIIVR